MTKKELLEEFLKSEGVSIYTLEELRRKYLNSDWKLSFGEQIEQVNEEIISRAFVWDKTEMGFDYWNLLSNRYIKFYKENKHRLKSNFTLEIKGLEHTIKFENGRVKIGCEDFSEEYVMTYNRCDAKSLGEEHNVSRETIQMYLEIARQILKNKENL